MIVSEAYFKIPLRLDDSEKRNLGSRLLVVAENAGDEFFDRYKLPTIGEILVEDGSTKFWARIRKSAVILTALGAYGSIRSGVDYLVHDGRAAASWMAGQIEPMLPAKANARRSRAPAAQELRRLFDRVQAGQLSAEEATRRAEKMLHDPEDAEVVKGLIPVLNGEFYQLHEDYLKECAAGWGETIVDSPPGRPEIGEVSASVQNDDFPISHEGDSRQRSSHPVPRNTHTPKQLRPGRRLRVFRNSLNGSVVFREDDVRSYQDSGLRTSTKRAQRLTGSN